MKQIRFIISAFLLITLTIFTCDLFQIYMYSFHDFYQTSFILKENSMKKEMLWELDHTAKKENVQILFINNDIKGEYDTKISIYCDTKTEEYLEKEYFIKEGVCKSLFTGKTEVEYFPWYQLSKKMLDKNTEGYYLIGEEKNIYQFKEKLINTYGGNMPVRDGSNSRKDAKIRFFLMWSVVITIILIMTYYQMSVAKKEYFIRLSFGESIWQIIFKNIVKDSFFFIGCFSICCFIIYLWNGRVFFFSYSLLAMSILLILNACIYLELFRYELKYSISNEKISLKLLGINYSFKFVLTLLFSISLVSNIFFIKEYIELKLQEDYYKSRKEYYYVQLTGYDDDKMLNLESQFYYNFFEEFDIQYNYKCVSIGNTDEMAICMNKNMKDYLIECIPEIENNLKKSNCVLLIPKERNLKNKEIESLKQDCLTLSGDMKEDVNVIRYDSSKKIIHNSVFAAYREEKNPVIIYSGRDDWSQIIDFDECVPLLELNKALCKVEKNSLEKFCKENKCSYMLANVFEDYQYTLKKTKREFMLNIVLFFIQFIIEILLITTIIRLEFEANRMEIVIKKILGYPKYLYMAKMYLITAISGLSSMVIIYLWNYFREKQEGCYLYLSVLIPFMVEIFIIFIIFKRQENENIQKTLKGGYL